MMICHVSADAGSSLRYFLKKNCSAAGYRIPLKPSLFFSEVLSLVDGQVPLLIELKIPKSSLSICEKTWEALKNYNGPYMVQSFNTLGIWWFRRHAPHVLRGQLSSNLTADNLPEPWILTFIVKHLLGNVLGRPDFISYKLADLRDLKYGF